MKKINIVALLGLLIGFVGIVSPILWDKYKSSLEVTVELNTFNKIFDKSNSFDGLWVEYKGEKIDKLYLINFKIENTGNKPIKAKDIISPIRILLEEYNEVIEVKIGTTYPDTLNVDLTFDKKNGEITSKSLLLT